MLVTLVDDFALYEADPDLIASECFPYGDPYGRRVRSDHILNWLREMEAADLVLLYEAEGKRYLMIKRWSERVRTKNPSRFPPPPGFQFQKSGDITLLCQQMPADASRCCHVTTNAALPPTPTTSPTTPSVGEKNGAQPASAAASRTQFAAIRATVERLKAIPEGERTDAEQRTLDVETVRLKKMQKKQRAGDFSTLKEHE